MRRGTFPLDERALALFRAALGATLLWDAGRVLASAEPLFAPEAGTARLVLAAQLAAAAGLALGARARACAAAAWLLQLARMRLAPELLDGADAAMSLFLFHAALLPASRRWALLPEREAPTRADHFAERAFAVQFACIYVFAAIWKLLDPVRRGPAAVGWLLSNPQVGSPALWERLKDAPAALSALGAALIALELAAPAALLLGGRRTRAAAAAALLLLQAFIAWLTGLDLFPVVMSTGLLALLPLGGAPHAAPARRGPSWAFAASGAALAFALAANLAVLGGARARVWRPLSSLSRALGWEQPWGVYTLRDNGACAVEVWGARPGGRVSLLAPGPRAEAPPLWAFNSPRGRVYNAAVALRGDPRRFAAYAAAACRRDPSLTAVEAAFTHPWPGSEPSSQRADCAAAR